MLQVLLIDDDIELCQMMEEYLEAEDFALEFAHDGQQGARMALSGKHDLVVLDVMMPGMNGFDTLRLIRNTSQIPVIMLTAKGDDIDRILGLELGADDYVAKPFNPRELVARVRAVLRRTREAHRAARPMPRETYRFGGWALDAPARRLVNPDDEDVDLTGGEFDLLMAFITHPQRVLSREQLLDWTRGRDATPFDRTIDVQLSRLRRKLGDSSRQPSMVRTVRGGGYLFVPRVTRD